MSDTPISDSTPHNVADLGMQIRRIERQLNAANERIKQLEEMYEGVIGERPEFLGSNVMGLLKRELNSAQQRIKRMSEALDLVRVNCHSVHHSKKHQHRYGTPCPVVAFIEKQKQASR